MSTVGKAVFLVFCCCFDFPQVILTTSKLRILIINRQHIPKAMTFILPWVYVLLFYRWRNKNVVSKIIHSPDYLQL